MKLKSLFKIFSSIGLVTAGGLTIGLFVDMIPGNYANVRMFDKNTYNAWKANKKLKINYATLPTSKYSFRDILDNPKSVNGGNFLFFFGSQAYKATNNMLWGYNQDFANSQGETPIYEQAIMQKVYDAFWGSDNEALGLSKINPIFLNYVDIVEKQSLFDAWNLKKERASTLGNYETNIFYPNKPNTIPATNPDNTPILPGDEQPKPEWIKTDKNGHKYFIDPISNYKYQQDAKNDNIWYFIDQFNWSVGEGLDAQKIPVVKGASFGNSDFVDFDFTPNLETFYEWRPNDGKDTKYEKVYYRNDDSVKNFLYNYNFIETYVKNVYNVSGVNKEGMLLCARNLNPKDYTNEITNPFEIRIFSGINADQTAVGNTLDQIIRFYNPDYSNEDNKDDSSADTGTDTGTADAPTDTTTGPATGARTYNVNQKVYHLNQLTNNLQENEKNMSLVEPKNNY